MHTLHQRLSHSAPYKPHAVGTRKYFFGSESEKIMIKFMTLDAQKGVIFSTFLTPPPHDASKKWVSSWGYVNSLVDAYIGPNNDFTRCFTNISTLGQLKIPQKTANKFNYLKNKYT